MTPPEASGYEDMLLAAGLTQLSKELRALHDQVEKIEETIGAAIPSWKGINREEIKNIQQLDLVRQTLDELSAYVMDLESAVPPDLAIPSSCLLQEAKLRDLARRLGLSNSKSEQRGPTKAEDIELF